MWNISGHQHLSCFQSLCQMLQQPVLISTTLTWKWLSTQGLRDCLVKALCLCVWQKKKKKQWKRSHEDNTDKARADVSILGIWDRSSHNSILSLEQSRKWSSYHLFTSLIIAILLGAEVERTKNRVGKHAQENNSFHCLQKTVYCFKNKLIIQGNNWTQISSYTFSWNNSPGSHILAKR